MNLIKKGFSFGERAAIDTIEALAQLQSFRIMQNERWVNFMNEGLMLSSYLWNNDARPYNLPSNVIPQEGWENETNINNFNLNLESLIEIALREHPEIRYYDFKLNVLTLEKRLKFQELLPKVDFRYNQLGKNYDLATTASQGPLFENNYLYGLKVEIPLRFSLGRGEYQKAKLKIESNSYDKSEKILAIEIKVKYYFNEFDILKKQIELQSDNYNNYIKLVKAEESRLNNGESSIFLINARENKALEALEKLIEFKTKYFKSIYALQWSAGLFQ